MERFFSAAEDDIALLESFFSMEEFPKERPPQIARRRLMRSCFDKGRDYTKGPRNQAKLLLLGDPSKSAQECCALNDFETLQLLIETGSSDVNEASSPAGFTALAVACVWGREPMVQYLLEEGADPSIANLKGATPLHLASKGGHLKVVELLLRAGVLSDLHRRDIHGSSPFMEAVHHQHLPVMRALRNNGAYVNDQRNDGVTSLHLAAKQGNGPLVRFLCEEGSEPNVRNDLGETPLFLAAKEGHLEAVHLLLLSGANSQAATLEGLTPFDVAEDPIMEGVLLSPQDIPRLEDLCVAAIRGNQRRFPVESLPKKFLPEALYSKLVTNY